MAHLQVVEYRYGPSGEVPWLGFALPSVDTAKLCFMMASQDGLGSNGLGSSREAEAWSFSTLTQLTPSWILEVRTGLQSRQ